RPPLMSNAVTSNLRPREFSCVDFPSSSSLRYCFYPAAPQSHLRLDRPASIAAKRSNEILGSAKQFDPALLSIFQVSLARATWTPRSVRSMTASSRSWRQTDCHLPVLSRRLCSPQTWTPSFETKNCAKSSMENHCPPPRGSKSSACTCRRSSLKSNSLQSIQSERVALPLDVMFHLRRSTPMKVRRV